MLIDWKTADSAEPEGKSRRGQSVDDYVYIYVCAYGSERDGLRSDHRAAKAGSGAECMLRSVSAGEGCLLCVRLAAVL